jgi:3D (Asp-Asp-Asp) domain-containing protein
MLLALIALGATMGVTTLALPPPARADASLTGIGFGVASTVVWERHVHLPIPRRTLYRLNLSQRANRVIAAGSDGIRVVVIRYERHGAGRIVCRIVRRYVERAPRPRVIAVGARIKVDMIATAYTPYCYGCDGVTATGLRAGPGIVAVDPRVIPLGTRLYIPGYGFALAGDTGGDIVGNRVDLGFASYSAAVRFGRRPVTVYVLV